MSTTEEKVEVHSHLEETTQAQLRKAQDQLNQHPANYAHRQWMLESPLLTSLESACGKGSFHSTELLGTPRFVSVYFPAISMLIVHPSRKWYPCEEMLPGHWSDSLDPGSHWVVSTF